MKKHTLPLLLLFAYLFILMKVLVFKELALIRIGEITLNFWGAQKRTANLIPFKSIHHYLLRESGLLIALINIVGNILALVPLGILVPIIFSNFSWKKVFASALASGIFIKSGQILLEVGIFDIDDILLNGLGVIIGKCIYNLYGDICCYKFLKPGQFRNLKLPEKTIWLEMIS